MMLLAAALVLHVGLAEPATVRLASTGTEAEPVEWTIGGEAVAWTTDAEAAFVALPAGPGDLWAATEARGPWRIVARVDVPGEGEATYVPAWTAAHGGSPRPTPPVLPALLVGCALLAALARRRSLLEAPRGPATA